MYLNRLTLVGFLGNDAEKKSTTAGKTLVQLSIATATSWKNEKGERQSITEWHRAVVWGEKLGAFATTLKKGAYVRVEGSLRSREYEKDGVTHRAWECNVESILKLERPERAGKTVNTQEPEEAPL
jgi:single-strand DNA-binding protein